MSGGPRSTAKTNKRDPIALVLVKEDVQVEYQSNSETDNNNQTTTTLVRPNMELRQQKLEKGKKSNHPKAETEQKETLKTERISENSRLLAAVKRHLLLYDSSQQKGSMAIVNAWKEIKAETGMANPAKRFSYLKMSFYRIKERIRTGEDPRSFRFPHMQEMAFLDSLDDPLRAPPKLRQRKAECITVKKRRERGEKLLDAIKQKPCIYDRHHPNHSDKGAVLKAWADIESETGIANPARKFSNLKQSYIRVKQRFHNGRVTMGPIRFPHVQRMEFLDGTGAFSDIKLPEWPASSAQELSTSSLSSLDAWEHMDESEGGGNGGEDLSQTQLVEENPELNMPPAEEDQPKPDFPAMCYHAIQMHFNEMLTADEEESFYNHLLTAAHRKAYDIIAKRNK